MGKGKKIRGNQAYEEKKKREKKKKEREMKKKRGSGRVLALLSWKLHQA